MTEPERTAAALYLAKLEPALVVGTPAHAAFILLRELLGGTHGAASHAPRKPRAPKAPGPPATAE